MATFLLFGAGAIFVGAVIGWLFADYCATQRERAHVCRTPEVRRVARISRDLFDQAPEFIGHAEIDEAMRRDRGPRLDVRL